MATGYSDTYRVVSIERFQFTHGLSDCQPPLRNTDESWQARDIDCREPHISRGSPGSMPPVRLRSPLYGSHIFYMAYIAMLHHTLDLHMYVWHSFM